MFEKKSKSVLVKIQPIYDKIIALTDEVYCKHLNEDYAVLACRLTAAMARKRPSSSEKAWGGKR